MDIILKSAKLLAKKLMPYSMVSRLPLSEEDLILFGERSLVLDTFTITVSLLSHSLPFLRFTVRITCTDYILHQRHQRVKQIYVKK